MTKKIYGVYGLIEYVLQLNIGGKMVNCQFKDGSITALGVVPATYMSDSPVIQYALEQSQAYQSGRVRLVRKVEVDGKDATASNGGGAAIKESAKPQAKVVEIACAEDAVEYLKQYGYKSHDLRTKTAIDVAARKQGIEFKMVKD